eukprot:jgi/Bigna1/65128/fgenesh1_kg.98_\
MRPLCSGGADRRILNKYGEPTWNNPVVRFVDSNGKDIIPRKGGVYGANGISQRMKDALQAFSAK